MGDFDKAFKETMINEGGYVSDLDDVGGETYKGISRVYNPRWIGWEIIDQYKGDDNFPDLLYTIAGLQNNVESFYKDRYWDVNQLDEFPQAVSEEMFDTGVNMGTERIARYLQKALNYLNRNGMLYNELVVDGIIGRKTLGALNYLYRNGDDEEVLLTMLNALQGQHYMDYMDRNPTQKKYARGWFKRVSFKRV